MLKIMVRLPMSENGKRTARMRGKGRGGKCEATRGMCEACASWPRAMRESAESVREKCT